MYRFYMVTLFSFMFMTGGTAVAHNIRLPEKIEQLELTRIADNTYAVHGLLAVPDKDNKAFISNTGVVITERGVVVIDTGGSLQVGELIVNKIQAITNKPIVAVFNSHIHGDHWLGNAAIHKTYPGARIYAHTRAIERLQSGAAEEWFDIFMRMTDNAIAGTELVLPDNGLNGGEKLQIDGLEIKTHHTGHAHTDSDIMVEFPKQKVLFTGDILEHRRAVSVDVPEDFSAVGQIDTIRYALELPVDTYVPVYPATA
jgi:glyoxylase-like metal-dependent hydrolase (beta-lactamase superfamily II)